MAGGLRTPNPIHNPFNPWQRSTMLGILLVYVHYRSRSYPALTRLSGDTPVRVESTLQERA